MMIWYVIERTGGEIWTFVSEVEEAEDCGSLI